MIVVHAGDVKKHWLPVVAGQARSTRSSIEDRQKDALAHAMEGEEEGLRISQVTAQVMTASVSNISGAIEFLQDLDNDTVLVKLDRVSGFRLAIDTNDTSWGHFTLCPEGTNFRVSFSEKHLSDGSFGCIREIRGKYLSPNDSLHGTTKKQVYQAAIVIALRMHKAAQE